MIKSPGFTPVPTSEIPGYRSDADSFSHGLKLDAIPPAVSSVIFCKSSCFTITDQLFIFPA
jgi:hypothetical protein